MTTGSRHRHSPRWVLPFLAVVVAALAAILLGNLSQAQAAGVAENRVGAFAEPAAIFVGPPERIAAVQRLGNDGSRPGIVVATGAVAKSGLRAPQVLRVGDV